MHNSRDYTYHNKTLKIRFLDKYKLYIEAKQLYAFLIEKSSFITVILNEPK